MVDLKEALRETSVPAGHWRASLRDFLVALIVFGTLFGAVAVDRGNAFPMPPPPELLVAARAAGEIQQPPPTAVAFKVEVPAIAESASADRPTLMLIMTFALAALAAFNATVWRHLRRSYVEPRRK